MKNLASLLTVLLFSISLPAQQVTNLNDSGPGSLRDAVFNASSGDVIRFDPSLLANGSDTLHLKFTISFLQGVTLKGLYNQTDTLYVSGGDSVQLFYMDFSNNPNQDVTLDSLALEMAFSDNSNGSAICVLDARSVEIRNCHIANNNTQGLFLGGAVYVDATSLELFNSSFVHNSLDNPNGGFGGAVSAINADFVVNDCVFDGNSNRGSGPAAHFRYGGDLIVLNSLFVNNVMPGSFGYSSALTSTGNDSSFISNCSFKSNMSTTSGGGGLSIVGSYVDPTVNGSFVVNCVFEDNSSGTGGAIYVDHGKAAISDCSFINNAAYNSGGAVSLSDNELSISNSTFINNISPEGSVFYNWDGAIGIQNSTILNSVATNQDPLFRSNNTSSFTVQSSIITSNQGQLFSIGNGSFTSNGYNLFYLTPSWASTSDLVGVDTSIVALGPIQLNGGLTPTMMPDTNSPALNSGNPNDFSNAQNGAIFGRRDIGAAERPLIVYDTTVACGPVQWWGATYSNEGVYRDTLFNANSIDSVGILVLAAQDTGVYDLDGTLYSEETDTNTTYQWVDCSNNFTPIAGATSINFLPPSNGQYAVILTNQNCVDTSACYNYNRFSVPENSAGDAWLTFYPNPTTGRITVNSQGALPVAMDILDLSGNVLYQLSMEANAIQLPPLTQGVYLVVWKGETGEVQVDRIVIR
ncbi:T9SS type A sorting domain-containing protein [Phaeocystidibacter luteus]|uniref:T9SS type A sorting domain-containing protein n=1 Tax=Phaeocystidibacter luteus TaxID=911197 RepID=A0A6N6RCL2_9FLAO|nr:T9SS type A sorting domain-containing protein [Phaeocystidibacter luteus]KAB2805307.1 T9SS type A sorting domain-containing protein [Phaeocystidibacter luteus]